MDETTHFGIVRNTYKRNNTLYLLGAGLHAKNFTYKIYTTFSRPRISYGLEDRILLITELELLERYE